MYMFVCAHEWMLHLMGVAQRNPVVTFNRKLRMLFSHEY